MIIRLALRRPKAPPHFCWPAVLGVCRGNRGAGTFVTIWRTSVTSLSKPKSCAGEGNPHLGRMTRFLRYVDKELGQRHCLAYFSPRDLTDVIAAVMHTVESVARYDVIPDLFGEWLTWANTERAYENPAARLVRAVWELIEHAAEAKSRMG